MFGLYSYPFYIAGVILQICCIIHAVKTGRKEWIYLLVFLPLAGAVVYIICEIIPDRNSGDFFKNLGRVFFPGRHVKEMERKLRISDTITNRLALADAYAGQKQYEKAIGLVQSCLDDPYINHVDIALHMARLLFDAAQYDKCLSNLEKARSGNSNKLERVEDELRYARALDYTSQPGPAEEEYKKVIRVHHSMEAMYHYGVMLKKMNRNEEARAQFQAVRDEKELHPKHVRRVNARWIRLSRQEMRAA